MKEILIDTGVICAAADKGDPWHQEVKKFLDNNSVPIVAPITILPEACYMLRKGLGPSAEEQLIASCVQGDLKVIPLVSADFHRCLQLMRQYSKANIGFVDASIVAVAERLKIGRILTVDRRHFSMFRPRHCPSFTLLP